VALAEDDAPVSESGDHARDGCARVRKTPVVSEVADPAGPAAEVLAASLNPADMALAAGLVPFRRPELPLVLGMDGVARRADGALVHFFQPAVP
jgi:hypothetical protein